MKKSFKRRKIIVLGIIFSVNLNANSVNYIIDSNKEYPVIVAEVDSSNNVIASYTYGDDPVPISRYDMISKETHYYHYDGNFNLSFITNNSGEVISKHQFNAFGQSANKKPITNNSPTFFAGHMIHDTSDNYYMRSRYYNPSIGRFTQQDSFNGHQGIPQSLHKYNYAHNDPVNNRDPSGKFIGTLGNTQTISSVLALSAVSIYGAGLNSGKTNMGASSSLANSSIQLMHAVSNGVNEIIHFNTKHTQNVVNGLLQDAEEHAEKIGGSPPEDPNRNHWKKEVRAFLKRAKRLADKRLKGNTRKATLNKIENIAKKAGVEI